MTALGGESGLCVLVCVCVSVAFRGYSILQPRCRPLDLRAAGRVGSSSVHAVNWLRFSLLSSAASSLHIVAQTQRNTRTHTYTRSHTRALCGVSARDAAGAQSPSGP